MTLADDRKKPAAMAAGESDPAPDPDLLYPPIYGPRFGLVMAEHPRVVFLRNLVRSPLTTVGDYTYFDCPSDPTGFERRNVTHHYGPERLIIGKFCALADGITFVMNAANHRMDGVSTYPFPIFGSAWLDNMDLFADRKSRGDTVVGNDVWFGRNAIIMPGVEIGDGAVIGAYSVVTGDVAPYAIVGGNPATEIRRRFDDDEIRILTELSWWDWPIEQISRAAPVLLAGTVAELQRIASGGSGKP